MMNWERLQEVRMIERCLNCARFSFQFLLSPEMKLKPRQREDMKVAIDDLDNALMLARKLVK